MNRYLISILFLLQLMLNICRAKEDLHLKHLKSLNVKSKNSFNLILSINDCLQCNNSYIVDLLDKLNEEYTNYKINIISISEIPKDSYFIKNMFRNIDNFYEDNTDLFINHLSNTPAIIKVSNNKIDSIFYNIDQLDIDYGIQDSNSPDNIISLDENNEYIRNIKHTQLNKDSLYIHAEYLNKIIVFDTKTGSKTNEYKLEDNLAYYLADKKINRDLLKDMHSFRHFRIDGFNLNDDKIEILFRTPRKYLKRSDGSETYLNRMGFIPNIKDYTNEEVYIFDSLQGSTNKILPSFGKNRLISYRWWGLTKNLNDSIIERSYLFFNFDINERTISPGFNHTKILNDSFDPNTAYDYYLTSNNKGDFYFYLPSKNRIIRNKNQNIIQKDDFINTNKYEIGDIISNNNYVYFSLIDKFNNHIVIKKNDKSLQLVNSFKHSIKNEKDELVSYYITTDQEDRLYLILKWKFKRYKLIKIL